MNKELLFLGNVEDCLEEFEEYLLGQRDKAESTVYSYLCDVKIYINFFREEISPINEDFSINQYTIPKFFVFLKKRKIKKSTILRRLRGMRAFWSFLYKKGYLSNPPMTLDEMDIVVKSSRNPTKPLSHERFIKIRELCFNELIRIK
ncbi:MAG: site-specific integrase [Anaerolineaceae bacterium]|nr:site-specific integrase [Anaerolineaceae bacterium]